MSKHSILLVCFFVIAVAGIALASFQFGGTFDYTHTFKPLMSREWSAPPTALASDLQHVFIGDEASQLTVATLDQQGHLTDIGSTPVHGNPREIVPLPGSGLVAMVTEDYRLSLVDVSDPAHPEPTEDLVFADEAQDLALDGDRLLVAVGDSLLVCAWNPLRVTARLNLAFEAYRLAVDSTNHLAYVGSAGLAVVDISGVTPALLGVSAETMWVYDLALLDGNHLAAALEYQGVGFFDVSNPAVPALTSSVDVYEAYKVMFASGMVYAGGHATLKQIDVSDFSAPVIVDDLFLYNSTEQAFCHRGTTALCGLTGTRGDFILSFRATNGYSQPDTLNIADPNLEITKVQYDGDFAFAAYTGGFLATKPRPDGFADSLDFPGYPVAMLGTYPIFFVVTQYPSTVVSVDATDPYHLQLLDTQTLPDDAYAADLESDVLYVGCAPGGLQRIDVSNPAQMSLREPWPGLSYVFSVDILGNLALLGDYGGGVQVFDLGSEESLSSFYLESGIALGFAHDQGHVLIAEEGGEVEVWDLADPRHPNQVGSWASPAPIGPSFYGLTVRDGLAYLPAGYEGLWVLDVSEPSSMTLVGRVFSSDDAGFYDLSIGGQEGDEAICLATYGQGLILTELHATDPLSAVGPLPRPVIMEPNVPNPFNPSTEIRFNLPTATVVRLGIYDLKGNRLAMLQDGPLGAGEHRRVWTGRRDDGLPVASGVYLARVETGNGIVEARKITLVQ